MKIKVRLKPSYEIEIKEGLIQNNGLPDGFVIADKNVFERYKCLIGGRRCIIEAGEASKSVENYKIVAERLSGTNEERIIAFGGGVVGDLAGFVASTYKRGIGLMHVPTTLLAMVDSSIGGKNGINIGEKKNYLGTIYQPQRVLIDPLFLETLPDNEFKNGLAEVIKYGFIFNRPRLELLGDKIEKDDEDLDEMVFQCCRNKSRVVEIDEKDRHYRHVLNFGHTIGHAIELLSNLSHGEAISIGMAKEAKLGERLGIAKRGKREELKRALITNGLPTQFPSGIDKEKMFELMNYDKKGSFIFALDRKNYAINIDETVVRELLIK
ncbi:3-dehydroquinate synthase [Candidatus Pacearchaeota archaeon]|nr:3-dehydroquinate synthase [Candidatus Pacearchaeota archaeon]